MTKEIKDYIRIWRYNIYPSFIGEYDAEVKVLSDQFGPICGKVSFSPVIQEYVLKLGNSNRGTFTNSVRFENAEDTKLFKRHISKCLGIGQVFGLEDIAKKPVAFQMLFPTKI